MEKKNTSCIINHLTHNIPTMSHYSWIKESRTLDKKLNGKKTSEIKKVLLGKRMSSNPQKLKKKKKKKKKQLIIYKKNDFGFISKIRNLTF